MAQVHTNGRADTVGPALQLGDFLPERRDVVLNKQTHSAWVYTNSRLPRRVIAELNRAALDYNKDIGPLLPYMGKEDAAERIAESAELQAALESQPEAWDTYVMACVLALIPTVQESELELVDLPVLEQLLRDLGYFQPVAEPTAEPAEAAESPATPLTGDSSPHDSPDSTRRTTRKNS